MIRSDRIRHQCFGRLEIAGNFESTTEYRSSLHNARAACMMDMNRVKAVLGARDNEIGR